MSRQHALLAVFVGGAIGSSARIGLAELLPHGADQWPWATLLVNIAGCLLLGWVSAGLLLGPDVDPRVRPFVATGICGGLTTFSAFQVELLRLAEAGEAPLAVGYAAASLILGLAAIIAGRALAARTHPPAQGGPRAGSGQPPGAGGRPPAASTPSSPGAAR